VGKMPELVQEVVRWVVRAEVCAAAASLAIADVEYAFETGLIVEYAEPAVETGLMAEEVLEAIVDWQE